MANQDTGIVDIRGKQYQTVAYRVQKFREAHPDYSLITRIEDRTEDCVVVAAAICGIDGRTLATGHAEEYRKASQINRTSALENAETSAIGRALAAFGFGGTEFATANEVQNAIHQQEVGGHSQGGEVSPRQPAHSALKTALRDFVHTMEGCGDWDTWAAFRDTKESQKLLNEVQDKLPSWWDGGEDMPAEFVPLRRRIEILESNLANQIADVARA